ncbi:Gfo/Idh/MocA family protein [Paludibaculum fermentans]|uniref:Gfo/Idh/MocA family protein n=1 Tax=Paludibaculum fermentans TaxID=1473598 RepID=UPI003EBD95D0
MTERREFIKSAVIGAAAAMQGAAQDRPLRVGFLGTGNRGGALLGPVLRIPWVQVTALCDVDEAALAKGVDRVQSAGQPKPATFTGSKEAYRRLVERNDVDAVIVATPWQYHVPMAVAAMKAGKAVGVEVPAAQTVEECWELLESRDKTGSPCMMLENWSFRRDNLAVLNMIRLGLLGEIVHCHCAHGNDCVNRTPWYFDRQGNARWGGEYLIRRNCDQYPTHSLGPVLSWMDINCGDALDSIISVASRSLGINHYFEKTLGADNPAAKRHYAQGDIVSSVIRTKRGNTIVLNNDMQLPRPYDNRWMIQGTEGVYSEERNSIYLWRRSPKVHEWEAFPPYQEKYDHTWWKPVKSNRPGVDQTAAGHGGTDPLLTYKYLEAVRDKQPLPLSLEDGLTMSVVVPLSQESIAGGSKPVSFPDFTRGRWQTAKPYFAVDVAVALA